VTAHEDWGRRVRAVGELKSRGRLPVNLDCSLVENLLSEEFTVEIHLDKYRTRTKMQHRSTSFASRRNAAETALGALFDVAASTN
jgi:hypothetical protein